MTTELTYRRQLLDLIRDLDITDEEAGEPQWPAYLSDQELAEAIRRLRPEATVPEPEEGE